ncbi:uncharacterized protein [Nicotiana sylvestris]|uniref:uncharacterized protein n=1 Tax=Nicotiana sylvestris TaxID=4096 RepID=UPI00388C68E4
MANQELNASVIDPTRKGEESDINLKEELYKLKHQIAEIYQAWAFSFTTTTKALLPKPHKLHHPNQSHTPLHQPPLFSWHPYPLYSIDPPVSPYSRLRITNTTPLPPLEPTFKALEPCSYALRFDLPVETEKPPKNPEQEELFRKVRSLEQSFKNMQGLGGQVSVAYKDLCLFPDVQLPVGYKIPKFDLYDGHGDLEAHLRGFCSKMRGAGGKDELLMAYFSQSLSGSAFEWYTCQDHSR